MNTSKNRLVRAVAQVAHSTGRLAPWLLMLGFIGGCHFDLAVRMPEISSKKPTTRKANASKTPSERKPSQSKQDRVADRPARPEDPVAPPAAEVTPGVPARVSSVQHSGSYPQSAGGENWAPVSPIEVTPVAEAPSQGGPDILGVELGMQTKEVVSACSRLEGVTILRLKGVSGRNGQLIPISSPKEDKLGPPYTGALRCSANGTTLMVEFAPPPSKNRVIQVRVEYRVQMNYDPLLQTFRASFGSPADSTEKGLLDFGSVGGPVNQLLDDSNSNRIQYKWLFPDGQRPTDCAPLVPTGPRNSLHFHDALLDPQPCATQLTMITQTASGFGKPVTGGTARLVNLSEYVGALGSHRKYLNENFGTDLELGPMTTRLRFEAAKIEDMLPASRLRVAERKLQNFMLVHGVQHLGCANRCFPACGGYLNNGDDGLVMYNSCKASVGSQHQECYDRCMPDQTPLFEPLVADVLRYRAEVEALQQSN